MKTAEILRKSVLNPGNNWITLLNSANLSKKNAVTPVNFHLYHYAGNNPVRYTDPDGRNVKDADNSTFTKNYPNTLIGTSQNTISSVGCVLNAYYRIAVGLGYTGTITRANKIAKKHKLYSNGCDLTTEDGVKLVNLLLKKEGVTKRIRFDKKITGDVSSICTKINELEEAVNNYYITIRIKYNEKAKKNLQGKGHHMNIPHNSVYGENEGFNISDTYSSTWISSMKDSEVRGFDVDRLDVFEVYDVKKNWSMIDKESMRQEYKNWSMIDRESMK